jgi:CRISPR locus-related DNA-binding protein
MEPILVFARKLGLDRAVLIVGKSAKEVLNNNAIEGKPNPVEVAEEIKRKLGDFGADVEIKLVNPFDFEECCIETLGILEAEKQRGDVYVSITGGTKLQSIAASCAAFIAGCRIVYVQELKDGAKLVEIPYSLSHFDQLSNAKKGIIKAFEDGNSSLDVAKKLGISKKTAAQYLKELKDYGLLEVLDGKVKRYRLTFPGRLCKARWGLF